jgi:hypothetical protein
MKMSNLDDENSHDPNGELLLIIVATSRKLRSQFCPRLLLSQGHHIGFGGRGQGGTSDVDFVDGMDMMGKRSHLGRVKTEL